VYWELCISDNPVFLSKREEGGRARKAKRDQRRGRRRRGRRGEEGEEGGRRGRRGRSERRERRGRKGAYLEGYPGLFRTLINICTKRLCKTLEFGKLNKSWIAKSKNLHSKSALKI
jgi:hypothetical protein